MGVGGEYVHYSHAPAVIGIDPSPSNILKGFHRCERCQSPSRGAGMQADFEKTGIGRSSLLRGLVRPDEPIPGRGSVLYVSENHCMIITPY